MKWLTQDHWWELRLDTEKGVSGAEEQIVHFSRFRWCFAGDLLLAPSVGFYKDYAPRLPLWTQTPPIHDALNVTAPAAVNTTDVDEMVCAHD